jgi:diaminopimelate epimerase
MKLKFTKMQGIGNDYVYVNCFEEEVKDPSRIARIVSERHFGIGADGLILICPSEKSDVRMRMYNADGSEGNMCGNGARCIAKYVYDHDICRKGMITLETKVGEKKLQIFAKDGVCDSVTVDMGIPRITSRLPEDITVGGIPYEFIGVDVGNPHAVYYVDSKEELDGKNLEKSGTLYEHHQRFPDGVNSEFVFVADRKNLYMRVWERGSGETLACGTGATASAYASMMSGRCDDQVNMHLRGGSLIISWDREKSGHIFMTGPAVEVYHGEMEIPD